MVKQMFNYEKKKVLNSLSLQNLYIRGHNFPFFFIIIIILLVILMIMIHYWGFGLIVSDKWVSVGRHLSLLVSEHCS